MENKTFDNLVSVIERGDILFFKDHSIISKVIRAFGTDAKGENKSWSHCEMCVDVINTPYARLIVMCSAREINGGMVELGLLNVYRFKKHNAICVMRPEYASPENIDAAIKYCISRRGTLYDYYSVGQKLKRSIVNIFKKDYYAGDNPEKDFCSECCRDSLKAGNAIKHKEKHTNPDPTELFAYPELKQIFLYKNKF